MKKLIISLVLAMALIGAVYGAAASITVGGVDKLGSGTSAVLANPDTTNIAWRIKVSDTSKVDQATVTFATKLINATVAMQVFTNDDCTNGKIEADLTKTSGVDPGDDIFVFDFAAGVDAEALVCTRVTYEADN